MDIKEKLKEIMQDSIRVKEESLNDENLLQMSNKVANAIVDCFKADGKVLFCGNGGSAADAQHLAAEFSGRFYYDREPLFSEALHVNTSYITAVANDYSYDEIYSRLVRAKGRKGDILIGMSTSGNSGNIIRAIETANKQGMLTVGMTGRSGGKMKGMCDILIRVPSDDTPRIQEVHMLLGHGICQMVETIIFPK